MNTLARPGIGAIRNLLEKWFDQLPEAAPAHRLRRCLGWHKILRR
jgi:hypothetical protein